MAASLSGLGLGVGQETHTRSRPRRLCSTYSPTWRPHGPYSPIAAICALTARIDCVFSSPPEEGFLRKLPLKQKGLPIITKRHCCVLLATSWWNCWMGGWMNEWMTHRSAKNEWSNVMKWENLCHNMHAHIIFVKSEGGSWDFNRLNRWVCVSSALNWGSMMWNPELIYFCLNIYRSRIIPSLAMIVIVIVMLHGAYTKPQACAVTPII